MNLSEIIRRIIFRLKGRVLHLKPNGTSRGTVLVSYITLPFLNRNPKVIDAHTNRWESIDMAQAFTERGYAVDLIDVTNTSFIPRKSYDIFIDNYHNMERLSPLLGPRCIKIFHATTSDWKFNNKAELQRFADLRARKGIEAQPDRPLPPNKAAELCDEITLLGNEVTAHTYAYAHKPITHIPISTTHTFASPTDKDFEKIKKNYIWFGGAGVVHKGLDLVVEAFATMPDYTLTICGKLDGETTFKEVYKNELSLPNISIAGFVDPSSQAFIELCNNAVGLVYPSCAEGQSGAVVLTMHAGLIPIISRESGVPTEEFGVTLKENTIEELRAQVRTLSSLSPDTLRARALATWEYARVHHTREQFARSWRVFIDRIISNSHV
jgi:glycosyltransferase involved in cell wall biosynthesis